MRALEDEGWVLGLVLGESSCDGCCEGLGCAGLSTGGSGW